MLYLCECYILSFLSKIDHSYDNFFMDQSQKPQCLSLNWFVIVKSDSSDPCIHYITHRVALRLSCVIVCESRPFKNSNECILFHASVSCYHLMSVTSCSGRFCICKSKSNTPLPLLHLLLRPIARAALDTYIKSLF